MCKTLRRSTITDRREKVTKYYFIRKRKRFRSPNIKENRTTNKCWENVNFLKKISGEFDYPALKHASDSMRDNRKLVLELVKIFGMNLQYASERLRDDEIIVLAAVKRTGCAIQYASERLKEDKNFLLDAIGYGCNLKFFPEEIRGDIHLAHIAIKRCAFNLKYVSSELQDTKDIVLTAIKRIYYTIKYASERLKLDKDIARFILLKSPKCYISEMPLSYVNRQIFLQYTNLIWEEYRLRNTLHSKLDFRSQYGPKNII